MPAYYNEIDPYAAGCAKVRVRSVCSAFYQSACGRSGKAPTPFQATSYSRCFCALQGAHSPAYGPLQLHDFRHKPRTHGARSGSRGRSECSYYRAKFFLLFAPGKSSPLLGDASEMYGQIVRYWHDDSQENTAIYCVDLARLENSSRTPDNRVRLLDLDEDFSFATAPYICPSKIFDADATRPDQHHTQCSAVQ